MLRQTSINLEYQFGSEFWRARPLLRGRAKVEAKLGVRAVALRLAKYTRFRLHHRAYDQRARVRAAVDAAAVEHGTGWAHIRNDIARQNVAILPTTQRLLAQYEPLAFRSLMELCSSSIVPPPATRHDRPQIPYAAMKALTVETDLTKQSSPAADVELREMLAEMLNTDKAVMNTSGATTSALRKAKINGVAAAEGDAWMDAWKDFQKVDPKLRASASS